MLFAQVRFLKQPFEYSKMNIKGTFTALFNNTRSAKFKVQLRFTFYVATIKLW